MRALTFGGGGQGWGSVVWCVCLVAKYHVQYMRAPSAERRLARNYHELALRPQRCRERQDASALLNFFIPPLGTTTTTIIIIHSFIHSSFRIHAREPTKSCHSKGEPNKRLLLAGSQLPMQTADCKGTPEEACTSTDRPSCTVQECGLKHRQIRRRTYSSPQ